jgi:hypothetical protein
VLLQNVTKLAAQAAIVALRLRAEFGKQVMRYSADPDKCAFFHWARHCGMPLFFASKTKGLRFVNLFFQKILHGVKKEG